MNVTFSAGTIVRAARRGYNKKADKREGGACVLIDKAMLLVCCMTVMAQRPGALAPAAPCSWAYASALWRDILTTGALPAP